VGETILKINHLSKKFSKSFADSVYASLKNIFIKKSHLELEKDEFWSLDDINLEIKLGHVIGIIGSNGSGKTTLMRIISGIYTQDKGTIESHGKIAAIFALKSGMHPHLSGLENIYVKASLYGLSKKETDLKVNDIIEFSGLSAFMDRPFGVYSSGMKAKLSFAILTAIHPTLFIIDEGLAVGDKSFQAKCFQYLREKREEMTTIYITNQHSQLENFADRIIIMNAGKIIGDTSSYSEAQQIYDGANNNNTTLNELI